MECGMQSAPYLMMIFLPPIYGNLSKESNTPILPPCVMGESLGAAIVVDISMMVLLLRQYF